MRAGCSALASRLRLRRGPESLAAVRGRCGCAERWKQKPPIRTQIMPMPSRPAICNGRVVRAAVLETRPDRDDLWGSAARSGSCSTRTHSLTSWVARERGGTESSFNTNTLPVRMVSLGRTFPVVFRAVGACNFCLPASDAVPYITQNSPPAFNRGLAWFRGGANHVDGAALAGGEE
jgi:hypothetical protein